jgi:tetratricopeptide (TPR) repeat protein
MLIKTSKPVFSLIPLFLTLLGLLLTSVAYAGDTLDQAVHDLQHEWGIIKYQTAQDKRQDHFKTLAEQAHQVSEKFPGRVEPLVWEAIILSSYAGELSGLSKMKALSIVKQARNLLLEAEKIDPNTLHGSIYTTLGSLHYELPGWPLSFGSDKKAKEYLEKALAINGDGIDPNYFYGDYLIKQHQYTEALAALNKALNAPPRPDRPIADAGRRQEIEDKIAEVKKHI